ncbi:MAG: hypothetical protein KA327_06985 [Pseudarcicella sp.]|nr:hypothetical protein [Pseudarcicella sp.]
MNSKIFFLLLWIFDNGSFQKISTRNDAIKSAEKAYNSKKYNDATLFYQIAIKNTVLTDQNVLDNYAKSLLLSKKNIEAIKTYTNLLSLGDFRFKSDVSLQLGNLYLIEKDTVRALSYYKKSLTFYSNNSLSLYNYELLIRNFKTKNKYYSSQQKNTQLAQKQSKADLKSNEKNTENQKNNQLPQSNSPKYNLSLTQARIILDAMKNESLKPILENSNQYLKSKKTMSETW